MHFYEGSGEQFNFSPYSTLPDITEPGWDCDPFRMIRLGDRGQVLYFVAVNHRSVPNEHTNPHYRIVLSSIGEFEVLTWDLERYVVVEGGERFPGADAQSSYWAGGEGGLAAYFAEQFGYKQRCFEPDDAGTAYLRDQGFSEEVIATYLFCRLVPSWHRRYTGYRDFFQPNSLSDGIQHKPTLPTFQEFVETRIKGGGSIAPSLTSLDYSYDEYVRMYEERYERSFTPEDWHTVQFLLKETVGYMLPPRSPVHEAAIAVNGLRDRLLAGGLKELWEVGASVLVPFGFPHGLTLKNFIDTLGFDIEAQLQGKLDLQRQIHRFAGMHSPEPGVVQPYEPRRKYSLGPPE